MIEPPHQGDTNVTRYNALNATRYNALTYTCTRTHGAAALHEPARARHRVACARAAGASRATRQLRRDGRDAPRAAPPVAWRSAAPRCPRCPPAASPAPKPGRRHGPRARPVTKEGAVHGGDARRRRADTHARRAHEARGKNHTMRERRTPWPRVPRCRRARRAARAASHSPPQPPRSRSRPRPSPRPRPRILRVSCQQLGARTHADAQW